MPPPFPLTPARPGAQRPAPKPFAMLPGKPAASGEPAPPSTPDLQTWLRPYVKEIMDAGARDRQTQLMALAGEHLPPKVRPYVIGLFSLLPHLHGPAGPPPGLKAAVAGLGEKAGQGGQPPAGQPQPAAGAVVPPAAEQSGRGGGQPTGQSPAVPPELLAAMMQAAADGDHEAVTRLAEMGADPDALEGFLADQEGGPPQPGPAKAFSAFIDHLRAVPVSPRVRRVFSAWEENDHPRGEDGRFGKGNGLHRGQPHHPHYEAEGPDPDHALHPDSPREDVERVASSKAKRIIDTLKGLPAAAAKKARAKVQSTYERLQGRYGRNYARAIVAFGLAGLPIPLPGSSILMAAPVLAVAELHRRIAGGKQPATADRAKLNQGSRWFLRRVFGRIKAKAFSSWRPELDEIVPRVAEVWFRPDGSAKTRATTQTMIGRTMRDHGLPLEDAAQVLEKAMLSGGGHVVGGPESYWQLVEKMRGGGDGGARRAFSDFFSAALRTFAADPGSWDFTPSKNDKPKAKNLATGAVYYGKKAEAIKAAHERGEPEPDAPRPHAARERAQALGREREAGREPVRQALQQALADPASVRPEHLEDLAHELNGLSRLKRDELREHVKTLLGGGHGGKLKAQLVNALLGHVRGHVEHERQKESVLGDAMRGHLAANPGATDEDVLGRFGRGRPDAARRVLEGVRAERAERAERAGAAQEAPAPQPEPAAPEQPPAQPPAPEPAPEEPAAAPEPASETPAEQPAEQPAEPATDKPWADHTPAEKVAAIEAEIGRPNAEWTADDVRRADEIDARRGAAPAPPPPPPPAPEGPSAGGPEVPPDKAERAPETPAAPDEPATVPASPDAQKVLDHFKGDRAKVPSEFSTPNDLAKLARKLKMTPDALKGALRGLAKQDREKLDLKADEEAAPTSAAAEPASEAAAPASEGPPIDASHHEAVADLLKPRTNGTPTIKEVKDIRAALPPGTTDEQVARLILGLRDAGKLTLFSDTNPKEFEEAGGIRTPNGKFAIVMPASDDTKITPADIKAALAGTQHETDTPGASEEPAPAPKESSLARMERELPPEALRDLSVPDARPDPREPYDAGADAPEGEPNTAEPDARTTGKQRAERELDHPTPDLPKEAVGVGGRDPGLTTGRPNASQSGQKPGAETPGTPGAAGPAGAEGDAKAGSKAAPPSRELDKAIEKGGLAALTDREQYALAMHLDATTDPGIIAAMHRGENVVPQLAAAVKAYAPAHAAARRTAQEEAAAAERKAAVDHHVEKLTKTGPNRPPEAVAHFVASLQSRWASASKKDRRKLLEDLMVKTGTRNEEAMAAALDHLAATPQPAPPATEEEEFPPEVRDHVRTVLGGLRSHAESLAQARKTDDMFQGEGRYESEAHKKGQDSVKQSLESLEKFRRLAKENGVDPEKLIAELGGVPDHQPSARSTTFYRPESPPAPAEKPQPPAPRPATPADRPQGATVPEEIGRRVTSATEYLDNAKRAKTARAEELHRQEQAARGAKVAAGGPPDPKADAPPGAAGVGSGGTTAQNLPPGADRNPAAPDTTGVRSQPAAAKPEGGKVTDQHVVAGDTFKHKDAIRAAGGKWDGKQWTVPAGAKLPAGLTTKPVEANPGDRYKKLANPVGLRDSAGSQVAAGDFPHMLGRAKVTGIARDDGLTMRGLLKTGMEGGLPLDVMADDLVRAGFPRGQVADLVKQKADRFDPAHEDYEGNTEYFTPEWMAEQRQKAQAWLAGGK